MQSTQPALPEVGRAGVDGRGKVARLVFLLLWLPIIPFQVAYLLLTMAFLLFACVCGFIARSFLPIVTGALGIATALAALGAACALIYGLWFTLGTFMSDKVDRSLMECVESFGCFAKLSLLVILGMLLTFLSKSLEFKDQNGGNA